MSITPAGYPYSNNVCSLKHSMIYNQISTICYSEQEGTDTVKCLKGSRRGGGDGEGREGA
jgi:hypothetical protein